MDDIDDKPEVCPVCDEPMEHCICAEAEQIAEEEI